MNQLMTKEAREAPRRIHDLTEQPSALWAELFHGVRSRPITQLVTVARGSSDHAAQYFSYLLARNTGLMPVSLSPSLLTLHHANLQWKNTLALAISQSGASPDLCHVMQKAREGGALTLAFINQANSALSRVVQFELPMGAGEEKSVAATKSFLLSLVNAQIMAGYWIDDSRVAKALQRLPSLMEKALQMTADFSLEQLVKASSVLVLSRGQGLPIAQEMALKFNEVCRLPALAYSAAEFRHGPMALVRPGDPLLLIGMRGPELAGLLETVDFLQDMGASVIFVAPEGTPHVTVPYPVDTDELGDPILAAQVLYPLIAQLALDRGHDPDQPAHLRKVTMTM